MAAARQVQADWAQRVPRRRLKIIGSIAKRIAAEPMPLAESVTRANATVAEIIASELLPLADACRYTAKVGRQVLAPESHGLWGRPWWLGRVSTKTLREPWGLVLILGPSNYPLFLPGVQIIQAIAAGNAVLAKPAPGCEEPLAVLKSMLVEAGVPEPLVQVMPPDVAVAEEAIDRGVDKVFLTGSVPTGKKVLQRLADRLTPSTMELSGCDAVFVSPQADLNRALQSIVYALRLNGGQTCISPRRIFVTPTHEPELRQRLPELLKEPGDSMQIGLQVADQVRGAIEQAVNDGATLLTGAAPSAGDDQMQPTVLVDVTPEMQVAQSDLFAPICSIMAVPDMPAAIAADNYCPYALGASVFGPKTYAEFWAERIQAGSVVLNDIVVPTADPRACFGGWRQSGWGVTRGSEGLLEMTRPKSICIRHGSWLPHLDKSAQDEQMLVLLLTVVHGPTLRARASALRRLIAKSRKQKSS